MRTILNSGPSTCFNTIEAHSPGLCFEPWEKGEVTGYLLCTIKGELKGRSENRRRTMMRKTCYLVEHKATEKPFDIIPL